MTLARLGTILEFIGVLFGASGLLGEQRLLDFEFRLQRVLNRLTSPSWPQRTVRKVLATLKSKLQPLGKFILVSGSILIIPISCIAGPFLETYINYLLYINIGYPYSSICGIFLFLFIAFLVFGLINGNSQRGCLVALYWPILLVFGVLYALLFLLIWSIWLFSSVSIGVVVLILFLLVIVLSSPYKLSDQIKKRLNLNSTLLFIAFVFGVVGVGIQVFA